MGDQEVSVTLRVGASSDATKLASAISHAIDSGNSVVLRAIGAGAVNQAIKGVAIAESFVGPRGKTLLVRPAFATVEMPDGKVSAIVLRIIVSETV